MWLRRKFGEPCWKKGIPKRFIKGSQQGCSWTGQQGYWIKSCLHLHSTNVLHLLRLFSRTESKIIVLRKWATRSRIGLFLFAHNRQHMHSPSTQEPIQARVTWDLKPDQPVPHLIYLLQMRVPRRYVLNKISEKLLCIQFSSFSPGHLLSGSMIFCFLLLFGWFWSLWATATARSLKPWSNSIHCWYRN